MDVDGLLRAAHVAEKNQELAEFVEISEHQNNRRTKNPKNNGYTGFDTAYGISPTKNRKKRRLGRLAFLNMTSSIDFPKNLSCNMQNV